MEGKGKKRKEDALSHLGADDGEAADVGEDLHDLVAVGHAAVDHEVLEVRLGVELHALEDRAGLEGVRLERRERDVRGGGVGRQTCSDVRPISEGLSYRK